MIALRKKYFTIPIEIENKPSNIIHKLIVKMDRINSTRRTVQEIAKSLQHFGLMDYIIFMGMLLGCSMIGIYFALAGKKKPNNSLSSKRRGSMELDYLVGGRKMKVFPVAVSLVASWISGITLLGSSTEMYLYGTEFVTIYIAILISGLIIHYIFLPVYSEMKIISVYEYLEERFDQRVRTFGSVMFFAGTVCNFFIFFINIILIFEYGFSQSLFGCQLLFLYQP